MAATERWNCTLCNKDMPAMMQEAHELHPFHIQLKAQEKGGQTVGSRFMGDGLL